jgi:hypothetical protein
MVSSDQRASKVSAPIQIVPTLIILEDEGEFTVRVGGQTNAAQIAQAVVPLLAGLGARKLLLITPLETKVFKFDSVKMAMTGAEAIAEKLRAEQAERPRIVRDQGAPPTAEEADAEYARYQAEEREAERVAQEQASTAAADPQLPTEEESPQPLKRSKARVLPTQNICGRCGGAGTLDAGAVCPVCKGGGKIAQWGRKVR